MLPLAIYAPGAAAGAALWVRNGGSVGAYLAVQRRRLL